MIEIRVLTVPLDPSTGLFDDRPVRSYLADREMLPGMTALESGLRRIVADLDEVGGCRVFPESSA